MKKPSVLPETVIGRGVKLEAAKLTGREAVRIEGEYTGDVDSEAIIVGEDGNVTGDMWARTVEVAGRVIGNIHGGEMVHIRQTAHVEGCVETQTLVTDKGSWFSGKCTMINNPVNDIPLLEADMADSFNSKVERFISSFSG